MIRVSSKNVFCNYASMTFVMFYFRLSLVTYDFTLNNFFSEEEPKNKMFLRLNYLHIAKAALRCSSYFSAIYFAEQWTRESVDQLPTQNNKIVRKNILERYCQNFKDDGEVLQDILRQVRMPTIS